MIEHDVPVKMRDGAILRADIYRPRADGKFPVLLVRTPYDKTNEMPFGAKAAAHGYVVVAQDTRGRYASEGEWYPFKYDSQDGYDTVDGPSLPYSEKSACTAARMSEQRNISPQSPILLISPAFSHGDSSELP